MSTSSAQQGLGGTCTNAAYLEDYSKGRSRSIVYLTGLIGSSKNGVAHGGFVLFAISADSAVTGTFVSNITEKCSRPCVQLRCFCRHWHKMSPSETCACVVSLHVAGFFWCVARGTGVVVGVRVLGNSGGATVIAVFMWCDSVRFEETCSRAPKIFWQTELNVKAPWSWIVQTSFHQNDLYAAGTCIDEMPFSSVLYSSGVQQATSALHIACIKCLHCCPQPQLVVGKCRSRAPHTSECHLFILTAVEGNNAAGNTLNEMKSGHRKQAGDVGQVVRDGQHSAGDVCQLWVTAFTLQGFSALDESHVSESHPGFGASSQPWLSKVPHDGTDLSIHGSSDLPVTSITALQSNLLHINRWYALIPSLMFW